MMSMDAMKTCVECGCIKPLAKFYVFNVMEDRRMPWCKACHNGLTKWHKEQAAFYADRQLGDPSEETIRFQCERIQAGWTEKKRARRRVVSA